MTKKMSDEKEYIFPKVIAKKINEKEEKNAISNKTQINSIKNNLLLNLEAEKLDIQQNSSENFSTQVMNVIYQQFGVEGIVEKIEIKKQELKYLETMIKARQKSLQELEDNIQEFTDNNIQEYQDKLNEIVHQSLEKYKELLIS